MLKDRYELQASGFLGNGNASTNTELQTAFSVRNNIGIIADQMSINMHYNSGLNSVKANYAEGGIGYFTHFSDTGEFEIYGGFGGGSQEHKYERTSFDLWTFTTSKTSTGSSELKLFRLFIQPSVGVSLKYLDLAFSTRFCIVTFTNIDNNISEANDELEYQHLNDIVEGTCYYFIEPSLTVRGVLKNVKFQLQIIPGFKTNPDMYFENTHIGFGVFLSLPLNEDLKE
jgi:hypothetical protein